MGLFNLKRGTRRPLYSPYKKSYSFERPKTRYLVHQWYLLNKPGSRSHALRGSGCSALCAEGRSQDRRCGF